ncbi:MAG: hypothetical protein HC898_12150, partial [Phycisphaerales bacterium]|nr:hypothetical protein [Phycisphaerales bacterium]
MHCNTYWRDGGIIDALMRGVVLGTMIGAGVLMGALWVGEAVRQGLKSITEARLGQTQSVLVTGERFFQADLAAALSLGEEEHTAAVLLLPGTGIAQEKGLRAGEVQVVGVDAEFWRLGQG